MSASIPEAPAMRRRARVGVRTTSPRPPAVRSMRPAGAPRLVVVPGGSGEGSAGPTPPRLRVVVKHGDGHHSLAGRDITRRVAGRERAERSGGRVSRRVAGRECAERSGGRVVLTRRGRLVLSALLTLLVVAVVGGSAASVAEAARSGPGPAAVHRGMTSVLVHPGDTLWAIAAHTAPDADPRVLVQEIIDVNALSGAAIQPGERLWVPRG